MPLTPSLCCQLSCAVPGQQIQGIPCAQSSESRVWNSFLWDHRFGVGVCWGGTGVGTSHGMLPLSWDICPYPELSLCFPLSCHVLPFLSPLCPILELFFFPLFPGSGRDSRDQFLLNIPWVLAAFPSFPCRVSPIPTEHSLAVFPPFPFPLYPIPTEHSSDVFPPFPCRVSPIPGPIHGILAVPSSSQLQGLPLPMELQGCDPGGNSWSHQDRDVPSPALLGSVGYFTFGSSPGCAYNGISSLPPRIPIKAILKDARAHSWSCSSIYQRVWEWDLGYGVWGVECEIWDKGYGMWNVRYGMWNMGYGM